MKVAYHDDTPVQDDKGVVIVKHGFSSSSDAYNETEYRIPRNGIIELNFYPSGDENANNLGIEVILLLF